MKSTTAFRISAGIGFLAVALGAFGAHGLQPLLQMNGTTQIWEKAAFYHLIHAVVLLLVATRCGADSPIGQSRHEAPFSKIAWGLFLAGVIIFSGSLYLLSITGIRWLGAITPIGGLSLLAGWGILAWKK